MEMGEWTVPTVTSIGRVLQYPYDKLELHFPHYSQEQYNLQLLTIFRFNGASIVET